MRSRRQDFTRIFDAVTIQNFLDESLPTLAYIPGSLGVGPVKVWSGPVKVWLSRSIFGSFRRPEDLEAICGLKRDSFSSKPDAFFGFV